MASGIQVYTRRFKKGTKNPAAATVTASSPPTTATVTDASPPTTANNEQIAPTEFTNLQKQKILSRVVDASDDSFGQNRQSEAAAASNDLAGNGVVKGVVAVVENRVKINLKAAALKNETKELSQKLKAELDQVRVLFQKLEDKKAELTSYSTVTVTGAAGDGDGDGGAYSHSQYSGNDTIDKRALLRVNSEMGTEYINRRALMRVNSEVGLVANHVTRPFRQLSIAVTDNSHGVGGFVEKEKRTPKANPYYRNSEFLLGKDRLPSNKRPKASGGRKHGRESDHGVGSEKHKNQVFKYCSNLLQRLMKHKHGWVFNDPVNAKMLGLHDYHEIIKHPMDLGTIKSRLAQNFYKSPKEFAEDVRITFHNAMTYNPEGQDVHVMAEQLSSIFEEKWSLIESEYHPDWTYGMIYDAGAPTPTSRKVRVPHFTHAPEPSNFAPVSRTPVPKKPKAKDPNKREMTYEEKQKLGTNLQSLPLEKLDNIVQIIKKKSSSLSQHDDELEVDIDSVDVETLWELDRFFTNYKKSLSKRKRKAEMVQQANQAVIKNPTSVLKAPKENKADQSSLANTGNNASRSCSSSSSSSDSGSSSSDSDSDSSSADGSDAGRSPRS